eukprot:CAMPEP_0115759254 /NCGR_PEP_ID=MMETSP0272-20121206/99379_1 /TAXON_ID=71861 /ORGANISM="Scrippsiella trochoidea, Strain CCMP3099" /LENGTH=72 /DNA_ID=CAMNT_0003204863 /DNA_START=649 /DNA_END=863 /DNA_ORIENTATION=+
MDGVRMQALPSELGKLAAMVVLLKLESGRLEAATFAGDSPSAGGASLAAACPLPPFRIQTTPTGRQAPRLLG